MVLLMPLPPLVCLPQAVFPSILATLLQAQKPEKVADVMNKRSVFTCKPDTTIDEGEQHASMQEPWGSALHGLVCVQRSGRGCNLLCASPSCKGSCIWPGVSLPGVSTVLPAALSITTRLSNHKRTALPCSSQHPGGEQDHWHACGG